MQKKIKTVILGVTNSGKSSVGEILKTHGWPVVEVDDEAQAKNSGIWPEDEEVLDVLFKEVNEEILKWKNVVFVTSFLELSDIEKFWRAGFRIIELHASYEETRRRRIERDGVPTDGFERFDRNFYNFEKIMAKASRYLALRLDNREMSVEEVVRVVEEEFKRG